MQAASINCSSIVMFLRVVLTVSHRKVRNVALKTRMLVASPTTAFAQRRRSCHVFAMVHQILLQAIGRGTPQFFFGVSSEGKKTNVLQFL